MTSLNFQPVLDCWCSFAPVHLNTVRENRVGQTAGGGGAALTAALWAHLCPPGCNCGNELPERGNRKCDFDSDLKFLLAIIDHCALQD